MDENKNFGLRYIVSGRRALFSDPITKVGGEKNSYHVPTYQALIGITESIYWKPTIVWHIDYVRILNPIQMESIAVKPRLFNSNKANSLSYYSYLKDVEYEVGVHFTFSDNPEYQNDRDPGKHSTMFVRAVKKGGRLNPFLGTTECPAYVYPFEEKKSFYESDQKMMVDFGTMYHSLNYRHDGSIAGMYLWHAQMTNGLIQYPKQSELIYRAYH